MTPTAAKPNEPRTGTQLGNTLKLLRGYKNGVSSNRLDNLYGMEFGVSNPNTEKNLSRLKKLGFARRLGSRGYWIASTPEALVPHVSGLGLDTEPHGPVRATGRDLSTRELLTECERRGIPVNQPLLRALHDLKWITRGAQFKTHREYKYGAITVAEIARAYQAAKTT